MDIRPNLPSDYDLIRVGIINKKIEDVYGSMCKGDGKTVIAHIIGNDSPVKSLLIQEGVELRSIPLSPGEYAIGRSSGNRISIPDDKGVSRFHAVLTVHTDGRLTLRDLQSANGTWLGDRKMMANEAISLEEGDEFKASETKFMVMPA